MSAFLPFLQRVMSRAPLFPAYASSPTSKVFIPPSPICSILARKAKLISIARRLRLVYPFLSAIKRSLDFSPTQPRGCSWLSGEIRANDTFLMFGLHTTVSYHFIQAEVPQS